MTIKILIVDPDIAFTVPIKRALEVMGDYRVGIFASVPPALEGLARDHHDVIIVDFSTTHPSIPALVDELRQMQPWAYVLVSLRTPDHIQQAAALNIQGTLTKPYFARQLIPVIRNAALARANYQPDSAGKTPEMPRLPEETAKRTTSTISEPRIGPDDTFRRVVGAAQTNPEAPEVAEAKTEVATPPLGLPTALAALPNLPEEATLSQMITGQTLPAQSTTPLTTPPAPPPADLPQWLLERPDSPPEAGKVADLAQMTPAATSNLAEIALEVATDDRVPLSELPDAFAYRTETLPPEDRPLFNPIAAWLPATPEELNAPTLAGATVSESLLKAPPATDAPSPDGPTIVLGDGAAKAADSDSAPPDAPPPNPNFDPLAQLALHLTQITFAAAADASFVLRLAPTTAEPVILAQAGTLSEDDKGLVLAEFKTAWAAVSPSSKRPVVFRYVHFNSGDTLLYATRSLADMILLMLFPGDVAMGTIRKQVGNLLETLISVPEAPSAAPLADAALPEAAKTLPSRPTDLRPPPGLRDTIPAEAEPAAATEAEAAPKRPEGPYRAYTFLWLASASQLPEPQSTLWPTWIQKAAQSHFWDIDSVEVQANYLVVQIKIPTAEQPAQAHQTLQREAAEAAGLSAVWADVYYVVPGGRVLSPQEIAEALSFQRELAS
jgi:CheY-like chemotaxis protein